MLKANQEGEGWVSPNEGIKHSKSWQRPPEGASGGNPGFSFGGIIFSGEDAPKGFLKQARDEDLLECRGKRWDGKDGYEVTTGAVEVNGVRMSRVVVYDPDSKEVAKFCRDEIGVPFKSETTEEE